MCKANTETKHVASKKWQYSYEEVLEITNNFEKVIGKGGFGTVFCGQMNDGNQVAVKMLSSSSSQGPREFQTEVISKKCCVSDLLVRLRHNLCFQTMEVLFNSRTINRKESWLAG